MGVKYVKVEGRKSECPCSVKTEKGVLWEYSDDRYRHFQTLCGPCAEDMFGGINMFKLPVVKPEQITELRPDDEGEFEPEGPTVDTTQASDAVLDMLANIAGRLTKLETEVGHCKRIADSEMSARYMHSERWVGVKYSIAELTGKFDRTIARIDTDLAGAYRNVETLGQEIATVKRHVEPKLTQAEIDFAEKLAVQIAERIQKDGGAGA